MNSAELEFQKEKLRVQYQFRERVALALIGAAATFSTGLLNWYTVSNSTEAAAKDIKKVAAAKAAEIKNELAVINEKHDEQFAAVASDTSIIAAINTEWKAGRTGDPEDMAKAEKAEAKVQALPK